MKKRPKKTLRRFRYIEKTFVLYFFTNFIVQTTLADFTLTK
jgi:hypothetical protein